MASSAGDWSYNAVCVRVCASPLSWAYVLHAQVWIRQSFREDGQPSTPVPVQEQSLIGPLHEGIYKGLSTAGNDIHEAVMTFEEAKAYAATLTGCQGFTYEHPMRHPDTKTRVWFKSKLNVLFNEDWWTYSTGFGM